MPLSAAAARSSPNRCANASTTRERQRHANGQRIGLRPPIGVVPDNGLQDRGDELVGERDQTDLGEAEMELFLEQGIEGRQQRLQEIVE